MAVACFALVTYALGGGLKALLFALPTVTLLVACIWFPTELGSVTTKGHTTKTIIQSPGCVVRPLAWVVLLVFAFGRFLSLVLFRLGWL